MVIIIIGHPYIIKKFYNGMNDTHYKYGLAPGSVVRCKTIFGQFSYFLDQTTKMKSKLYSDKKDSYKRRLINSMKISPFVLANTSFVVRGLVNIFLGCTLNGLPLETEFGAKL